MEGKRSLNLGTIDSSICVSNCDAKLYLRPYVCNKDDVRVRFKLNTFGMNFDDARYQTCLIGEMRLHEA